MQEVTPSIFFMDSHVTYKGKAYPTAQKLRMIVHALSRRPQIYVVPITSDQSDEYRPFDEFLKKSKSSDELVFERVSFNHPLLIAYSSGTTGAPKCIVHKHGMLIQLRKVSVIHNCPTPEDVVMVYSSTSWIVFNGMCGHLSTGATPIFYNGSLLFSDAK